MDLLSLFSQRLGWVGLGTKSEMGWGWTKLGLSSKLYLQFRSHEGVFRNGGAATLHNCCCKWRTCVIPEGAWVTLAELNRTRRSFESNCVSRSAVEVWNCCEGEQLMSSVSEHWTRCDADTCPRLDTCPYPNGSSDHWSLDRSPTLILTTQRNSLRYYFPNKWYQILGIVWWRWQGV